MFVKYEKKGISHTAEHEFGVSEELASQAFLIVTWFLF